MRRHSRSAVKPPTVRSRAFASSRLRVENLRPGLERDTQLIPWLIADTVCGEVSRFLGVEVPARYSDWLDAKAERRLSDWKHKKPGPIPANRGTVPLI